MSSSIPLTQAVTAGDERAVSALLANGVNINETTSGGQTALILAIIFGHTNIVRLLVNAGADPHLRDNLGLNAIEWAHRRGLREALSILTNDSQPATAPGRIVVNLEEPEDVVPPAPPPETEKPEQVPHDEKSRRWLAGLKQRMTELEGRRLNRNEPHPERPEPPATQPEPPPQPSEPHRKPPAVEAAPPPLMTAPTKEAPIAETKPLPPLANTEPVTRKEQPKGRILVPPEHVPSASGTRKRCPQCNAIYDSDLLMYCSHHIVPLVDADEQVIPEPPKTTNTLFWIMIGITLAGSILLGSLITSYLYKTTHPDPLPSTAAPQSAIQKGSPELSSELAGKAVSLPEAQCPLTGPGPISGTVTVRVIVDRKGQVSWAKGSGGDWLMRGAATEAAMKSTFSPEKLRSRETDGTITYTFKP